MKITFDKSIYRLIAHALLIANVHEQMPSPVFKNLYCRPRLRAGLLRFKQHIHGQEQRHMIFNEN